MFHAFLVSASFNYQMGPGGTTASLIWYILGVVGLWKMFQKAGEAGWQAIIPIWNIAVLFKIAGRPMWWVIVGIFSFLIIPGIVFLVMYIIAMNDVSKSFGRGVGTTLGLIILAPIFYLILGFGSAQYLGPAARGGARAAGSFA